MRVTLGMKLVFAAAIASMSLFWVAPVPTDPPRTDSSLLLVIEQPSAAAELCPFV